MAPLRTKIGGFVIYKTVFADKIYACKNDDRIVIRNKINGNRDIQK